MQYFHLIFESLSEQQEFYAILPNLKLFTIFLKPFRHSFQVPYNNLKSYNIMTTAVLDFWEQPVNIKCM